MMAEYSWFDKLKQQQQQENSTTTSSGSSVPVRTQAYLELKEEWKNAALEIFFMYYPKVHTLYTIIYTFHYSTHNNDLYIYIYYYHYCTLGKREDRAGRCQHPTDHRALAQR